MKDDERLSDEILVAAGHYLYASAYASEYEEKGGSFGPGARIEDEVPPAPKVELLELMRAYEQKLADAWKLPPKTVLTLMGLDVDNAKDCRPSAADALYLVLMSCQGQGISLRDGDYDDELDAYQEATGDVLEYAPFYDEMYEFRDLANAQMELDIEAGWVQPVEVE